MDRQREYRIVEEAKTKPEAFGEIFEKYYPAIFRYVLHRTGNAEAAADITAETFFKALNKLNTYRVTPAPFSSWLYKIAGNESNYYFRKKKYEPVSYNEAQQEDRLPGLSSKEDIEKELIQAQEEVEKNEKYQEAKTAILELPVKYQEVLVLRFLEEKKIGEIAEITGKKEGTIKSLLSRGLDKVRKVFEQPRKVSPRGGK